jgi:hypothetical protein
MHTLIVGSCEEADVDYQHSELAARRDFATGKPSHGRSTMLIIYAVTSGFVAFIAGAIVSLVVSPPLRLAVWSATTAASSVTAGIVSESRIISACRPFGHRVLRCLARLSLIS